MWVYNMKYDDDLWLEHCPHRRRIYQFAQYAAHLCTGETIACRAIRTDTIDAYLQAAASFLKLRTGIDPRFELGDTKKAEPIRVVLEEYRRWEEKPNRREPWTVQMQRAFDKANAEIVAEDKDDTLPLAMADWFALGLSTGFRRTEWAQPDAKHANIHNPDTANWKGVIPAKLPQDFVFYDLRGRKIRTHQEAVRLGIQGISRVRITWRVQKNKQNGESKTYVKNVNKPDLCPVNRALRIVARYLRIIGPHQPNVPLAVYMHQDGPQLIISPQIKAHMQAVVAKVLGLNPNNPKDAKELAKWTAHSIRVGACCILFALGFSPHEIKMLLRWLSETFMLYLRDIAWVARKQTDAMTTIANEVVQPFL